MEEISDIVRETGRQQTENSYYRTCYKLLKQLQDLVAQASDDLLCLPQYKTLCRVGGSSGCQVVRWYFTSRS
ncbi:hypothetical protein PDIG_43130 [Penicillium digitatum PHI26]|uniref:Uncharacterized protein n=2 Tax=Penicillium digitatum TaxID=36651 RepID=K9FSA4_PEND2|nr:hypothetical protein PDIP_41700 [Penicillium digitatum Pd1]EKV12560.1 hypothetical protein PDIG_43130 [Penicillium digitatum PHI26]EKV15013.1 hypothetical protein PDIP_41700 [Penicillium digitatum Pd1]